MILGQVNILEDIMEGLENWPELRPSPERIEAFRAVRRPSDAIKEMLGIWESGHGVLSTPERVEAVTHAWAMESKIRVNREKAKFIADSLATAPRRAALARAMLAGPVTNPFAPKWRLICDQCGWRDLTSLHVTICPQCQGPLGQYEPCPEGVMEVWKEEQDGTI
jgi:hypothetical protein